MRAEQFFDGGLVEPVTRQGIFETIVRHYRAQRRRCPAEGQCNYHLGDDECFIGPLIGAEYDRMMEGRPVRELVTRFAVPTWFCRNLGFIEELQRIHDNETNWGDGIMPMVLEMFAAERGLTMPA
jgi:hypothetical protein